MLNNESIVEKNPSILCTELDNEAVLLDLETKCYYGLNEVALQIWNLINGTRKINSIAENICKLFEVAPEKALGSVTKLVKEFEDNGLVTVKSSSGNKPE
ncbi:MAG: hypothetical protein A3C43_11550 [Candidatus Schekmanbacteria bacterium RIFCSPHIGHO2_02_FULL_38_11]|uniref:PqqD family protein n=1 Tax=Candidatus Schekmanbacteria bacterium RIFCSPLOWO2_12_FULL_38_15 TaxID=1817883 RepID=A0A1F7SLW2_9BACT|nr:MAG: hypothetical protein A2043_05130 [Candidatus Schekmanbacteria bacterium GWA2_38_9]OGL51757.1 MAG: hypothetical protein A3H37_11970 [Candidatus Schekmanbacteria bacterium RIFCSPLOWO2_02_FULL_38_14]OGL52422.1 MAG: hypothetical protein A3C43_11550 [Candidatus Schekmanbacteria bacterium RIFCSPHIGHO2_02_FULL_38_11]OGL54756.1 MAG: hypothetical protein A3G31_09540 [Candidatus Schekmanbacteria bacterium RIFCSPLOWO2_12_FULL_38_15]